MQKTADLFNESLWMIGKTKLTGENSSSLVEINSTSSHASLLKRERLWLLCLLGFVKIKLHILYLLLTMPAECCTWPLCKYCSYKINFSPTMQCSLQSSCDSGIEGFGAMGYQDRIKSRNHECQGSSSESSQISTQQYQ